MKIYGVKYDCNAPSPKKISIPLNSQFKVNFQVEKDGQMIDFTAPGAPALSVSCNGTALSSDSFLNKGPVYQIDTGNVATRQSVKAALPGSEFNLFVELTDGDVYEIDEVGGGGDIPRDLSVDSITFPHNVINEEEVEANRYAVMLDGEMVVDGNIEANDARLTTLNVSNNLTAGTLDVNYGPNVEGSVTTITNGTVEVGMYDGVSQGIVTTNWLNLGDNESSGGFTMIGESFSIIPAENGGQIGTIQFSIDPGNNGEGNSVEIKGQPQILIGGGGYIDLTEGVPITVYDSVNDTTVDLVPTHVTIDGTDYVIMAATAPQP